MAVTMTFYSNFSKRDNSTKQPSGGTNYNVVFKDSFSIIGGVVKLQVSFDTAKNYTAAKYGSNYYTVVDVVSNSNGIVEISLSLDVLATYKTDIAGYTSLIERAPTNDNIEDLPDDTIVPLQIRTKKRVPANVYSYGVSFMVQTKNDQGVLAYFLDLAGFNALLFGFALTFWTDESKNITSMKVVAMPASKCGGTSTNEVYVAKQSYPVSSGSCYKLETQSYVELNSATVNIDDLGLLYTDERRYNSDYVKLQCTLNGEVIDIDTSYIRYSYFKVYSFTDPLTSDVRLEVRAGFGGKEYLIASANTNIGIGFMFTDAATELSIISSVLSNIGRIDTSYVSRKTGEFIPGANLGKVATILPRGIQAGLEATTTGAPSGSSIAATMYGDVVFYVTQQYSSPKNAYEFGYPYLEVKNITGVGSTGFYKFANPQISLAALDSVKDQVNSYLANGFFYE